MDKSRFIEMAPIYYALAVGSHLHREYPRQSVTLDGILAKFTIDDGSGDPAGYCLLEREEILTHALEWLRTQEVLHILEDEFGPKIYILSEDWAYLYERLRNDTKLPFYKHYLISDKDTWLHSALSNINELYLKLGIEPEDFYAPDKEWAPLPLDRDDETLLTTIRELDKTIESVRGDNGYASTLPEERSFVLEALSSVSQKLKQATTVSLPYLRRYAFEPLAILVRRFKGAAISVTATATREALVEFLKQHGIKLLEQFWK